MGLPQKTSIINKYNLDLSNLQGYTFGLDEEWLDFIIMNRNYVPHKSTYTQYDYLKGATADDKLFSTIEQYENSFISQATAIKILNCMDIGTQICLKNNKCLEHLYYIESITPLLEEKNDIQLQIKTERQPANSITEKIIRQANNYPLPGEQYSIGIHCADNIEQQNAIDNEDQCENK